jgi:hypothetical protein
LERLLYSSLLYGPETRDGVDHDSELENNEKLNTTFTYAQLSLRPEIL